MMEQGTDSDRTHVAGGGARATGRKGQAPTDWTAWGLVALMTAAFAAVCWSRPGPAAANASPTVSHGPEGDAAASRATDADPAVSISVCLDGFGFPVAAVGSESPSFAPRWSRLAFPELKDVADCGRFWRTHRVCDARDWEGLTLRGDDNGPRPRVVKTCAEWRAACDAGLYAYSTYDMCQESFFIPWSAILPNLPHLLNSPRSTFQELELRGFAGQILPPGIDRYAIMRPLDPSQQWRIVGNTIHRDDDAFFGWVEPIAFGDLDGDGWEDLIVNRGGGATEGTMRGYGCDAYARRADGLLVSISGRMLDRPSPPTVMAARRAEWRANFGLPINTWIELEGRCGCGDIRDDGMHPLHVRLRSEFGYLTGSYTCANNPKPVPLAGALSTKTDGMLHEFGIDRAWTADIGFEWKLEGGDLVIAGSRCGIGHMETDEWIARGAVPGRAVGR
jgi:hypothetical protein